MDKIDILYDHYKESNLLCQNAQKDRNKYFKYLNIAIFINLLFILYPLEITDILNQLLDNEYSITTKIVYIVVQSFLWALIVYLLTQYLHKNIFIERQYIYLSDLEKEMSIFLKSKTFNREGSNYLKNYPIILNILDVFYKWILPVIIILINGAKIYFEYYNNVCLFLKIFDTTCYTFITVLIILYLKFLHPKKKNKKYSNIKTQTKAKNTKN